MDKYVDDKIYNFRRLDNVEIIKVIKITAARGKGISGDPVRIIELYYDVENGNLLFELDHWIPDNDA